MLEEESSPPQEGISWVKDPYEEQEKPEKFRKMEVKSKVSGKTKGFYKIEQAAMDRRALKLKLKMKERKESNFNPETGKI